MEIRIAGNPNEIADLVKEIQSRQGEITYTVEEKPLDSQVTTHVLVGGNEIKSLHPHSSHQNKNPEE